MRRLGAILLLLCGCASAGGCLARQVATDGIHLRQAVMDMYTDQAIDNLIRALENRPFVQLAYSNLQVLDMNRATATATGNSAAFTGSRTIDLAKRTINRGSSFASAFPFGVGDTCDRTLSFKAEPVVTQNYIYTAYLEFAHNPALFVAADHEPLCDVHIARKCGHKWYWVPAEAGPAFTQLVLSTALLPPPQSVAVVYWETTIASVAPALRPGDITKTIPNKYLITLASAVPNDDGFLVVAAGKGGKKLTLPVDRVDELWQAGKDGNAEPAPSVGPGAPTTRLFAYIAPTALQGDPRFVLNNASVQFFAQNYPNLLPQPSAGLQQVQDSLESIRLLLNKPGFFSP
jgi:hypothetical protein